MFERSTRFPQRSISLGINHCHSRTALLTVNNLKSAITHRHNNYSADKRITQVRVVRTINQGIEVLLEKPLNLLLLPTVRSLVFLNDKLRKSAGQAGKSGNPRLNGH